MELDRDKGGQREQGSRLGTEQAIQLEAFPNPKMHKAFPPSLNFLSLSLFRGRRLTKHKDIA